MNPEHTAKTLAALNLLSEEIEDARTTLNNAIRELHAPPGVTYYRCPGSKHYADPTPEWLIVMSGGHKMEIRYKSGEYWSNGLDGPGPDVLDAVRVKIVGLDFKRIENSWEPHYEEYFLIVEETA